MNFDFTDEQRALGDLAGDLFAKHSSPARLRRVWEDNGERDSALWTAIAEAGLLAIGVSESRGGAGGDAVDLALVLEEAGRAAIPEPLAETVVASAVIADAGSDDQRDAWLPRIARGEATAALALGDDPFVLDGATADVVLVHRDGALHLVPGDRVRAQRIASTDRARRLYAIEPRTGPETEMRHGAARNAADRAAAATACVLNGVSMWLVSATVAYVKERHQFGRPVGSFQAVKHKLATAHVLVESARSAAWYAAYALAGSHSDRSLASSVAKAYAAEAAAVANAEALQCHGGIGFTWEHDLHLWLKRGKALEAAYGSAAQHRARIASAILDSKDSEFASFVAGKGT